MKKYRVDAFEMAFCMFLGIIMVYPSVILRNRGFSMTTVGIVSSLGQVATILFPLIIGYITRKVTKDKLAMLFCLGVVAVTCFPVMIGKNEVLAMICFVIMIGVAGTIQPEVDGYVNKFYKGDASKYSVTRAWGTLAYVAILVLTKVVAFPNEESNYEIFIAALAVCFLFLITTILIPNIPAEKEKTNNFRIFGFSKQFYLLMLIIGISKVSSVVIEKYLAPYMIEELHYGNNFAVFTAFGSFWEFISMRVSSKLLKGKKVSYYGLLIVSLIAHILRFSIYRFTDGIVMFAIAQTLHAFTFGTFHIATMTYIGEYVEEDLGQSATTFYWAIAVSLPQMLGMLAAGWLIDGFGYNALFSTALIFPTVSLLISVAKKKELTIKI